MVIYIIICVAILLLALIIGIYIYYHNRYQVSMIKIKEAEDNIDSLLNKKLELLLSVNEFMKKKKKKISLDGIDEIDKGDLNSFELNTALSKFNKTIVELTDYNKDIKFDDEEKKILKELEKVEIDCLASERYYNDNVVGYNNLISKFPSSAIGKLLKCNEKEFYTNEKEEIFEILKK